MPNKKREGTNNSSSVGFRAGDALWGNVFKKEASKEETAIAILRRVPLFKGMKKRSLREFEKLAHRRSYRADETIFWEGEPGVGMYIVQAGTVAIYKGGIDNEREELAKLGTGEFFGELALLDESPRSATAVALDDSQILGLFRPELLELIERKPRLGNKFLFNLALLIGERLKHTNAELQAIWEKLEESKVIT
ncbi:MAG: cyclic nucleotide-binding domain-containing protein [bacterium]